MPSVLMVLLCCGVRAVEPPVSDLSGPPDPNASSQNDATPFPLSEKAFQPLLDGIREAVSERSTRIELELQGIQQGAAPESPWAKEWAGTYYTGDHLGMNVSIEIAPKSGVSYRWTGCLGLYDANHGDVVRSFPDGVEVKLAIDERASQNQFMSSRLYFVRWGDQKYLVPKSQMRQLVNNYNEGGFARESMFAVPRMQDAAVRNIGFHEEGCPRGRPVLPAEYSVLLIDKPVVFKITSVASKPVKDLAGSDDLLCTMELEGGHDRGAFVGMKISYDGAEGFGDIEFTDVRADSATATVWLFGVGGRSPQPLKVGTEIKLPGADLEITKPDASK